MTTAPELKGQIVLDEVVPARAPWTAILRKGQTLRIVDLEGNQAVDFLMYALEDDAERYSAQDTIAAQGNIFLREGSVLMSNERRPMAVLTDTSVAYHDTIGGACSCESNTLRYGHHTKAQHACVENFLQGNARWGRGKRDMVSNINWFKGVTILPDGATRLVSARRPGQSVTFRAEMDVIVMLANCPHVLDARPDYTVTPVRALAWRGPETSADDAIRNATPEGLRAFLNVEEDLRR